MSVRRAIHAGSWYSDNASQLTRQLDVWLSQVPADHALPDAPLPLPGARVIISPHAGYAYSGPCAAWAFQSLDLSTAKRIFILHPSHHHHLRTAALPVVQAYETPLTDEPLPLDLDLIKTLLNTTVKTSQGDPVKFSTMSRSIDEAEHSAEMQLPYIHRLLQNLYPGQPSSSYPPLVPIMVGGTSPPVEKALGQLLAPYIADPENAFVISSDFCHWGSRFGYTYYLPDAPVPATSPTLLPNGVRGQQTTATESVNEGIHNIPTLGQGINVKASTKLPRPGPKIFESIAHADRACMCAIATGEHDVFLRVLRDTSNTVCGRHPIGVFMAGREVVQNNKPPKTGTEEMPDSVKIGKFRFMRYERSSDVVSASDSSVSYVSAFAVLD